MLVDTKADTGPFRRAIWQYVYRLFGLCNDAYNYRKVNIYMQASKGPSKIKMFIKKLVTDPVEITREEFRVAGMGYSFRNEEKVHVGLIASEARRMAALLYALRSVVQHQTLPRNSR